MTSFLDEARSESQWKARTPCRLGRALAAMTDADRAQVQEALDASDVTGQAISNVLERKLSVKISSPSVNRHRRNECQCGRVVR